MSSRAVRSVAAAALVLAAPAAAQRVGAVDVGVFGRYTDFDNSLTLDNTIGFGGRAAVYVQPGLSLELDVSRTSATPIGGGSSATHTPIRFRVAGAVSAGPRVDVLLGGGFVHNSYGGSLDVRDNGGSLLLGLRHHTTSRVWVRLGLDLDVMFHTSSSSPFDFYTGNWSLQLGVGTLLNGGSAQSR
jgi:outer membrane protein with beta-barrel domain